MLSLPQLSISTFSPNPSLLLSPHPPSYLHLLSQGPCGTLRGWWGWGWWWCRWWWNSHSVSSLPVLEPEASPSLSPWLSLFLHTLLPLFKEERWRVRNKARRKASCRGHSFIHTSLCSTPHHHATYATCVCVCSQPVCFPCCYYCVVLSLLTVTLCSITITLTQKNPPRTWQYRRFLLYFSIYFYILLLFYCFQCWKQSIKEWIISTSKPSDVTGVGMLYHFIFTGQMISGFRFGV